MIAFIDDQREVYGVEPICKVLPIAPSTYHDHAAKRRDPKKLSARAQRDMALKPEIARVFAENFEVYGARKVWRQLLREGIGVARCTVERLMGDLGLQGVIRGRPVRTTVQDKAAPCPLDHVNRQFHAPAPNRLWLSDFTYVSTWSGFVYVAFIIDAYARHIVGWRVGSPDGYPWRRDAGHCWRLCWSRLASQAQPGFNSDQQESNGGATWVKSQARSRSSLAEHPASALHVPSFWLRRAPRSFSPTWMTQKALNSKQRLSQMAGKRPTSTRT